MDSPFAGLILKDSLTNSDIFSFVIFDFTFLLIILTISKRYMLDICPSNSSKEVISTHRKRFGWILSLVNSFVLSLLAIIYTYYRYIDNNEYNKNEKFPLLYISNNMLHVDGKFDDFMIGRDNLSHIMCIHLAIVNIIDLIYGSIYYPDAIDFLSGWIHHIVYIWIVLLCTTGNGLILTSRYFAKGMGIFFLLEIPTFMLSLGHIFKSLRSDYGFGFSFWVFRIILHAYFIVCDILTYQKYQSLEIVIQVLLFLTFTMHVYWFYSWSNTYVIKPIKQVIKKTFSKDNLQVSPVNNNNNENNNESIDLKKNI